MSFANGTHKVKGEKNIMKERLASIRINRRETERKVILPGE